MTWSRFAGGERGADLHIHHEHVDGFYVLEGELTFRVGPTAERVQAGPGTLVLVPPRVVHAFDNDGDETAVWLNFHAPSTGFAAYLRGARDGFDSTDPPSDGGLPASEALITTTGAGALGTLAVAVSADPADEAVGGHFAVGDGRFVNVRVA